MQPYPSTTFLPPSAFLKSTPEASTSQEQTTLDPSLLALGNPKSSTGDRMQLVYAIDESDGQAASTSAAGRQRASDEGKDEEDEEAVDDQDEDEDDSDEYEEEGSFKPTPVGKAKGRRRGPPVKAPQRRRSGTGGTAAAGKRRKGVVEDEDEREERWKKQQKRATVDQVGSLFIFGHARACADLARVW